MAIVFVAGAVGAESRKPDAEFPPRHAIDFAAADLDHDGHVDLVYLLGGGSHAVRVYYGDPSGYSSQRSEERDGRLRCTNGHREQPIGIRAAISGDHGRTWRESDIVSLRSDGSGPPSDSGYPLSAELNDGTLVTVHYITRDGITGVEATRWRNPWGAVELSDES